MSSGRQQLCKLEHCFQSQISSLKDKCTGSRKSSSNLRSKLWRLEEEERLISRREGRLANAESKCCKNCFRLFRPVQILLGVLFILLALLIAVSLVITGYVLLSVCVACWYPHSSWCLTPPFNETTTRYPHTPTTKQVPTFTQHPTSKQYSTFTQHHVHTTPTQHIVLHTTPRPQYTYPYTTPISTQHSTFIQHPPCTTPTPAQHPPLHTTHPCTTPPPHMQHPPPHNTQLSCNTYIPPHNSYLHTTPTSTQHSTFIQHPPPHSTDYNVFFVWGFILCDKIIINTLFYFTVHSFDKAFHSLGYKYGYSLPTPKFINPVNKIMLCAQKVTLSACILIIKTYLTWAATWRSGLMLYQYCVS